MKITNQSYNPEFGAIYAANSENLKILRLSGNSDLNYIKRLPQKIDTRNLMPGLAPEKYLRWNEMLEYAADNAQKKENITYLAITDGKPCGIITFTPANITKLDCICTWPVKFGEKVKFAGKTLFYQMYRDFLEMKGKKIKLDAITNGPYDTVEKYKALGFKKTSNVYPTKTEMEINFPKVKEIFKELGSILKYEKTPPEKIDLNNLE